ncbi:MAG: hypothetical protein HRT57_00245 [Crocinitomicaceae bacterium]|nr:hypothetical protein [Crocinitomicaceae bacterium]
MRITLLIATLLSLNTFAGTEIKIAGPQFQLTSSEKQSDLTSFESIYVFKILDVSDEIASIEIRYSIDGVESRVNLKDYTFEVKAFPGKHKFQIYIGSHYKEIYSDTLKIEACTKDFYDVHARSNYGIIETLVDKPVIYLYPEFEQDIQVRVNPVGEMSFTYPKYNEGWSVIAQPDGTIKHEGNEYNYLFWESKHMMNVGVFSHNGGSIVEKKNILSFLENKLSEAGFTSKEKADFITYWVPRMIQYDEVLIEFIQNSNCDQFATLDILPIPDNTNRFYMSWAEYNGGTVTEPRKIQKMDRSGFDILEWGGQQLILNQVSETL